MDPISGKRTSSTEGHGSTKILKTEEVFEFQREPTLYSDDMSVEKHLLELKGRFIPFKTSGLGQLLITNEVLTLLYEKKENDPPGEVECGIVIFPVPDFDDTDINPEDWDSESQKFWINEIGSFLTALRNTGVTVGFVVSPFWYKSLTWKSLHAIATHSSIDYDIYVSAYHEAEYDWHLDSESMRSRVTSEEAAHLSTQLNELKITNKYILPGGANDTSVWVVDSELAYNQLEDDEAKKLHQFYYEYSSDENEFENSSTASLCQEDISGTYKHGTVICKILSNFSSNRTSIHFVKCNKIGNIQKHIMQCLSYIRRESKKIKRKCNVVVITLGNQNFRATATDDYPLHMQHSVLHKNGFIFCCSAGNVKFSEHEIQPEIPERPLSFFPDCEQCIIIGSHGINGSKEACVPSTFASAGCCVCDKMESDTNFEQGVTTWALGENIVIPKINNQKDDQTVCGTSVSVAVVAGAATLILPELCTLMDRLKKDRSLYSTKFKTFLNNSSDAFVCPRHSINRNLIFNVDNALNTLGYENIR